MDEGGKAMDWDQYFMSMVYLCALKSRDPSSKLGAVLVGPDNEVRSTGYNGLPRGIDYRSERDQRPEKYFWYEHAERNSIYNAARVGVPTLGCTLYTNAVPCADCARAIVNAGIEVVVVRESWAAGDHAQRANWGESCARGRAIMEEAVVECRSYAGPITTEIYGFTSGKRVELGGQKPPQQGPG
jgi:dCMP deaminase